MIYWLKLSFPIRDLESIPTEGAEYYVGVDLAASPLGDYTVFAVIRKEQENLILAGMERYKGVNYKTQCRLLSNLYAKFKPRAILIDKSSFGDMLINELRVDYGVPCEGFLFTPQSRNMILTKLINLVLEGRLVIPRSAQDPYTISLTDVLIHELSGLYKDKTRSGLDTYKTVTRHDDVVMSLALAVHAAEQIKSAVIYIRTM